MAAALLAVAVGLSGCSEPAPPKKRPDVVLILIDTLRPDHLPFYGFDERNTAPFLTELSQRATVFERAFSTSSWTAPSTASVFTSLYPNQHGVMEGFFRHARRLDGEGEVTQESIRLNQLPRSFATLPEAFKAAGYTTYGVGTNVNIGSEIGFDRGFDHFVKLDDDAEGDTLTSPRVFELLRDWRKGMRRTKPNFVYLHFNDVHGPHAAVKPWFNEYTEGTDRLREAYNSEITFLDKAIQRMFNRSAWEDAIVMVVSDHGQEFMEHGRTGHPPTLYRELVQVLMMVVTPGQQVPGVIDDVNVSLVDVLPTLAELAGIASEPQWEGTSLAPFLQAEADTGALRSQLHERPLFAHRVDLLTKNQRTLFGVIRGDWQLIHNTGEEGPEMYDFIHDPDNVDNVYEDMPDLAARLEGPLIEFKSYELIEENESVEVDMDDELYEQLQSLGYTGD